MICFLEVYFWQNLLGDDDEDEAFVFVQIWERTGEKEFKRFFCLADRRVSVSLLSMSFDSFGESYVLFAVSLFDG